MISQGKRIRKQNIIIMSRWSSFFVIFLIVLPTVLRAQDNATVYGRVTDDRGRSLALVNVAIMGEPGGTSTDHKGNYIMEVPAGKELIIAFSMLSYTIQFDTIYLEAGESREINKVLTDKAVILKSVEIRDRWDMPGGMITLDPKESNLLPTYGGLETLVKLVGLGVSSGNELSSTYSVRGGNFDENLVYANDIEIYRPFLVRSGQQEGLSFLNSDLVSSVSFSSGGFEARYGDKMSSVLDVKYKRPDSLKGHAQVSLLGANSHIEGGSENGRFMYLAGLRYKSNQYVLNAMETQGEFKPNFFDFQTYLTWMLNETDEINILGYYSSNKYNLIPETRETSYGTIKQAYRLTIYFDGLESDQFRTALGGLRYVQHPDTNVQLKYIVSAYSSLEDEKYDIQGQYWIGLLENDLGSDEYGEVAQNLGVGTFLDHARNLLDIYVVSAEHKGLYDHDNYFLQWGVKAQYENIRDRIWEWNYIDSSAYSIPHVTDSIGYTDPSSQPYQYLELDNVLISRLSLESMRYSGYVQTGMEWITNDKSRFNLLGGVRTSYWDVNGELLISPRISCSFEPKLKPRQDTSKSDHRIIYRLATGLYQQPPFYRELRDMNGNLHTDVKAQKSMHFVAGMEYGFEAWQRPFKLIAEAYYKNLTDLIPYVVDNVRIRYLPEYTAHGYAYGVDLKINGEFVPDAQSWISVSYLNTQEDIEGDFYYEYYNADGELIIPGYTIDQVAVDSVYNEPGYIRRPADQRVNVSIFFQDYLPQNPSYKMHMSLVFGSRLPFGPPGTDKYKHVLKMPPYRRVDIGFSKQIIGYKNPNKPDIERKSFKYIRNAWISLEIFNLLQNNNTVSYIWVTDVNDLQYAVPNYLTPRQLNVKLLVQF